MINYEEENKNLNEELSALRAQIEYFKSAEELHKKLENDLFEKQNILRTVIDSIPDTVYVKDLQLRKIIANKAEVRSLGLQSENDVIGKDDFHFYPHDVAVKFEKDDREVLDNDKPLINREDIFVDGTGTERCFLTTKIPWKNIQGDIIGLIGIGRDITARIATEQSLKDSLELQRAIFDNSFDGISIYEEANDNSDRRLIDCNARYAQMSGRTKEELLSIGKTVPLVSNITISRLYFLDHVDTHHGAFKWLRPDGKENIIEFSSASFRLRGKLITVGIDRDVTEQYMYEKEREKLIDELQKALAEIKNLSGLLPICANCKKIREDNGYWSQIEEFIQKHSDAKFSHSLCPDCRTKLYPPTKITA